MKLKKLNQKGFSIFEVLLILLILLILGFVGWYVLTAKQRANKNYDNAAQGAGDAQKSEKKASEKVVVQPKDETDSWYLYSPPGKEYQIRLPDGWKLQRYSTSSGVYAPEASSIVYAKGTAATVTQVEGGRDFSGVPFALNYLKNSELSPLNGTKQAGVFKTKQGLSVDKYKYLVTEDPEAIGPPKGTTQFSYTVTKGDYTAYFVHDIQPGETDQTAMIEKAIATFEFL